MARRIKLAVAVALVVSAIPTGRWAWHTRPWEAPVDRAYRLCGECGLETAKIDWLIGRDSLLLGPAAVRVAIARLSPGEESVSSPLPGDHEVSFAHRNPTLMSRHGAYKALRKYTRLQVGPECQPPPRITRNFFASGPGGFVFGLEV